MNLACCITFDVDCIKYAEDSKFINEFDSILPQLYRIFKEYYEIKATWFIRLDNQIKTLFGEADFFIKRYSNVLDEFRSLGHEIAWHPHFYKLDKSTWIQNNDVSSICSEIEENAQLAIQHGITSLRSGWGFQTNETMQVLNGFDFVADSSAIPRPKYPWEKNYRDWRITPKKPYFPSIEDYRKPGPDHMNILEIPMSVTHVQAPYDHIYVERYINLSYHRQILENALMSWLNKYDHLVTITHPYELLYQPKPNGLISFSQNNFLLNLEFLVRHAECQCLNVDFLTISKLAEILKSDYS